MHYFIIIDAMKIIYLCIGLQEPINLIRLDRAVVGGTSKLHIS